VEQWGVVAVNLTFVQMLTPLLLMPELPSSLSPLPLLPLKLSMNIKMSRATRLHLIMPLLLSMGDEKQGVTA